jgi:hypothetical protein
MYTGGLGRGEVGGLTVKREGGGLEKDQMKEVFIILAYKNRIILPKPEILLNPSKLFLQKQN